MKRILHFLAILLAPALSHSSCWEAAGQRYGIDPALLRAIGWKESRGWPNAVGPRLPDGHRALGVMQINSVHLPALAKFGIQREDLFDACVSQQVGAWVLANCISLFGATWKSVGCYCAGPASKNTTAQAAYVMDVQRFYAGYSRQAQIDPARATPAWVATTDADTSMD